MCEDKTTKVVVSLGVGTGLVAMALTLLVTVGLAAVAVMHCVKVDRPTTKVFPQLRMPALPKLETRDGAELGPVNTDALREQKVSAINVDRLGDAITKFVCNRLADQIAPATALLRTQLQAILIDDEIIDEPKPSELKPSREADERPAATDEPKTGWQSECPNCPNYRPPVTFVEVPRNPPSYPTYRTPNYLTPSYPVPSSAPSYAPSVGGTWIQTAAGAVWLPSGFAYEHDSGLLRNLQTGVRSPPGQTNRPPALAPYRTPRLPEQRPLADDSDYRVRPAVPDFEKRGDRKTGGYACAACGRITVGDQWATQWTEEGTPISFMCRECWDKSTPEQRQHAYLNWYRRATEPSN